jgi:precorrin-6B C5,15-methyltransferase / cobalt-precorrin-6B C5,C15-methyltransferase
VFVGGSKGSMEEIIDVALARLKPGGRLVVNAITLENAGEAYQAFRRRELVPEVTLLQVSRGEPLARLSAGPLEGSPRPPAMGSGGQSPPPPARYLRYEALNPIQIFAVTKPGAPA